MNPPDEIHKLNQLILQKELEHKAEGLLLMADFKETYESLRPMNILKSTLKDAAVSPDLGKNLINAALGMATRFIANKITTADKTSPIISILQALVRETFPGGGGEEKHVVNEKTER